MRRVVPVGLLLAFATPALAQFKGYYDISRLEISTLRPPAWARKVEDDRLLYLCLDPQACPSPTAIAVKGVLRADTLEEAFASGALSPPKLQEEGAANAQRLGSQFLGAKAVSIGTVPGVHMEAAANNIYFVTKFIGRGQQLLDIKVTSPDLELARKLSSEAAAALALQVFK